MKLTLTPYERNDLIIGGAVHTFNIAMTTFPDSRERTIRVWLPQEYDGVRRFPVIYMHDGQGVFQGCGEGNKMEIDRALTALKFDGINAIVVAIDTAPTRGSELTPPYPRGERGALVNGQRVPIIPEPSTTDLYADFVVEHLKPLIDENFMTLSDVDNTCIGGLSAGGSASYYMILRHPEVFGRAFIYSPGLPMFSLEKLLEMLDEYDITKLDGHRIAFFNGDQSIDATSVDYVLAVYRKLRAKGMDSRHLMFMFDSRQTHNEKPWAKYLAEILFFLFAEDNSQPQDFRRPV